MATILDFDGGCLVVDERGVDAICAYPGAEDVADELATARNIEVDRYHYVCGYDEMNELLGLWGFGCPACGSLDCSLVATGVDDEGEWQSCECNQCGCTWLER